MLLGTGLLGKIIQGAFSYRAALWQSHSEAQALRKATAAGDNALLITVPQGSCSQELGSVAHGIVCIAAMWR